MSTRPGNAKRMRMKKMLTLLALITGLLVAYLLLWPVGIDPSVWSPPKAPPMTGIYESNTQLRDIQRLELPDGAGPEDVAIDRQGRIYGGVEDGRVLRYSPRSGEWTPFADTGGRPLGMDFDERGNLIVADARRGLLQIGPDGEVSLLIDSLDDRPFGFTDDVDVAADGAIYFTDASSRFHFPEYQKDALEHRPHGRLLVHDPDSGETRVLLDELFFANGVAVSPDGDFVLVNETWTYRVIRYWLKGPKAGEREVLIDNLPGFPDGISTGENGIYWIALASPRNALLDATAGQPWLRRLIARLPTAMQPDTVRYSFVLGINASGTVVRNLQDPDGASYAPITSVEEYQGRLYLGSLSEPAIGIWTVAGPIGR